MCHLVILIEGTNKCHRGNLNIYVMDGLTRKRLERERRGMVVDRQQRATGRIQNLGCCGEDTASLHGEKRVQSDFLQRVNIRIND